VFSVTIFISVSDIRYPICPISISDTIHIRICIRYYPYLKNYNEYRYKYNKNIICCIRSVYTPTPTTSFLATLFAYSPPPLKYLICTLIHEPASCFRFDFGSSLQLSNRPTGVSIEVTRPIQSDIRNSSDSI
jgi:hypothetical protein